uniref:Uncharacterized protein n=1 Tax=Anopheles coluzzii TaxID=1518534 RepID=A0A8W7PKR7_ANOCL
MPSFWGRRLQNSASFTVHTAPLMFSTRMKHLCSDRLCRTAFWDSMISFSVSCFSGDSMMAYNGAGAELWKETEKSGSRLASVPNTTRCRKDLPSLSWGEKYLGRTAPPPLDDFVPPVPPVAAPSDPAPGGDSECSAGW